MRDIYFDNAAAVPPDNDAIDLFRESAMMFFANQEASGAHAKKADDAMAEAASELVSAICGASKKQPCVMWTNSGTDSISAAVSAMTSFRPGDIVSTVAEHASLDTALERISKSSSASLGKAKICSDGQVDFDHLSSLLNKQTALVAIHHVNSETGAMQNLVKVRELMKQLSPQALFLADTMQSTCKLDIPWKEASLDAITVSGQKIGAPCGGALIFRPELEKCVRKIRSSEHLVGRCVPAAAITIASQAAKLCPGIPSNSKHAASLKSALLDALERENIKFKKTLSDELSSPYILHFTLPGYQSAIILRSMLEHNISAASGSACESETNSPSKVLAAMGFSKKDSFSAIRISTWTENNGDEACGFAAVLAASIRKY